MGAVLDINGPVNADTTYVDGELVARNAGVTLPEVTHVLLLLSLHSERWKYRYMDW